MMKKLLTFVMLALLIIHNVSAQFSSVVNLTSLPISTNTREKPQSKVWIHDNKQWTLLSDANGAHVWRLDGTTWTKVLTVASSTNQRADCKVVGDLVHILLFRDLKTDLISIEYDPASSTYKLWTGRPSTVRVALDAFSETATIDVDTQGRMWMTYDDSLSIKVIFSDSPYSTWSTPITVAQAIDPDDIGAVVAFPMLNKIGVFWSNQATKRFGFRMHTDGSDPALWSADELPASQSALNVGNGMADDHMNLKVASNGTLYCAVKTSYDSPGYPRIALLVRNPNGIWDNLYGVSEIGTRGIVVLNEQVGKIRVVYASSEDGGDILYNESSVSSIAFGPQQTLINGIYNNPTCIKNTYNGEVAIVASSNIIAVGVLASDNIAPTLPLPGTPGLVSPANNATGISLSPTLSWNAAANAATYQMQLATISNFSTLITDSGNISSLSLSVSGLNSSTQYYWRVRAVNATGAGAWSAARSFTTLSIPAPQAPSLISPSNNATGVSLSPTFTWNASANAITYQLQLSTNNKFKTLVADISNISSLLMIVSGLNNNTQYFWRVRAVNLAGAGKWSAVWKFTTQAQSANRLSLQKSDQEELTDPEFISLNKDNEVSIAARTALCQPEIPELEASPNPFQTASKINFTVPEGGEYSLVIYNITGNPVRILKQGYAKTGENFTVSLKGSDLPKGFYIVRLQSNKSSPALKLIRQ